MRARFRRVREIRLVHHEQVAVAADVRVMLRDLPIDRIGVSGKHDAVSINCSSVDERSNASRHRATARPPL